MDKQKQNELMARADGWKPTFDGWGEPAWCKEDWPDSLINPPNELPDYFTDNEIDRMVRGLSDNCEGSELMKYVNELADIVDGRCCEWITKTVKAMAIATPEQKVEAYLKAKGLWDTKEGCDHDFDSDGGTCHKCGMQGGLLSTDTKEEPVDDLRPWFRQKCDRCGLRVTDRIQHYKYCKRTKEGAE